MKLGSVVTDILGQSSRAMLEGLRDGSTDAAELAAHARGKLRRKAGELVSALEGRPTAAHRFLLASILRHVDFLRGAIAEVEAGKKKSARTLKGRVWLKTLLCEAAWGAIRTKNCYLSAKFHKLKARRGPQRALIAIAHKILVSAYHILKTGLTYRELGGDFLDRLHLERRTKGLIHALESLGYDVTLNPRPEALPQAGTP